METQEKQLCICLNYPGQTSRCPVEKHKDLFEKYVKEFKNKTSK